MGPYVYKYNKPASFDGDQLLVEVLENNLYPQTFEYDETQVSFGFKTALTTQEETTLFNTVSSHVADPYWREKHHFRKVLLNPPRSEHLDISY